jgi:hypothetical protein
LKILVEHFVYFALLIIEHDDVEDFEDAVEDLFVEEFVVVEVGGVAVVDEVFDELALLKGGGHFVDFLRGEGGEELLQRLQNLVDVDDRLFGLVFGQLLLHQQLQ